MPQAITFVFENHRVNVAADMAAILFSSALRILSLDARLLPNYREIEIYRDWTRGTEIEDPGRNTSFDPPPVTIADKVSEVCDELYNAAVDHPLGGYPCFNRAKNRWAWNSNPASIAQEMNHSYMFDFHVSPVHVERAQVMLRGRA